MPEGKAFWRFFSRARVLAWKRGPDWVKPGHASESQRLLRGGRGRAPLSFRGGLTVQHEHFDGALGRGRGGHDAVVEDGADVCGADILRDGAREFAAHRGRAGEKVGAWMGDRNLGKGASSVIGWDFVKGGQGTPPRRNLRSTGGA